MTCPWCGSDDTHEMGGYGSLLMTSQWFCEACTSPFEFIRHRGSDVDGASQRGGGRENVPTPTHEIELKQSRE